MLRVTSSTLVVILSIFASCLFVSVTVSERPESTGSMPSVIDLIESLTSSTVLPSLISGIVAASESTANAIAATSAAISPMLIRTPSNLTIVQRSTQPQAELHRLLEPLRALVGELVLRVACLAEHPGNQALVEERQRDHRQPQPGKVRCLHS